MNFQFKTIVLQSLEVFVIKQARLWTLTKNSATGLIKLIISLFSVLALISDTEMLLMMLFTEIMLCEALKMLFKLLYKLCSY